MAAPLGDSSKRNLAAREAAKAKAIKNIGALTCTACGFDYGMHYGELGEGFIECHRIKPVSECR